MQWYRTANPTQAEAIPAGPSAIVFHWSNERLRDWGMTFGGSADGGYTISGLCDAMLGIKKQSIDGPSELLDKAIPGDWIVRPGVGDEQIIKELVAILKNATTVPVRMEFRAAPRPVYVVDGTYEHKSIPGGHDKDTMIYADKTVTLDAIDVFGKQLVPNSGSGGGTGDFREFLDWVGDWIGTPIVSEVKSPPTGELSWFLHGRSPFTKEMEAEDRDPKLVLANITAQTGLHFRKETRSVKILFISRGE
jgi:hypothetical protein